MRTIHVLAAGFATLAGATLVAAPAGACDDRYPLACSPAVVVAEPDTASVQIQPVRKRASIAVRAAGKRRSAGVNPIHNRSVARSNTRPRATASNQGVPKAVPDERAARAVPEQRAVKVVRGQQDDADENAAVSPQGAPERDRAAAAPVVQDDETKRTERPADPIVIVSREELNEIDLGAIAPPEPADQSWLARLLAALGGAFAAASVLRFLAA
jgi:hypothetical protein